MICLGCQGTQFVRADNYNTCISCGIQAEYNPTYYTSYAAPVTSFRRQYYSRAKRFIKVLKEMKSELIAEHFEHILQTYSFIEFLWNMKVDKKRKYFYSQKVILWFILKRLGIDVEVPVLKNKERTKEQLLSMNELLPE